MRNRTEAIAWSCAALVAVLNGPWGSRSILAVACRSQGLKVPLVPPVKPVGQFLEDAVGAPLP